ncbi:MAG: hypothetical protein E6H56_02840 [Betaproteobacteria bacterium]|nr:MAG: hypothetical protein E6H56_02840 [Betaproteobacteria bacterium]
MSFTIGGTTSGLSGSVVLQNNGGDNLSISANGGFTFAAALTNSSSYAVTVLTQPAGQTCTVASGAGTVAGANITNIAVTCAANTFTVGGTVSGLSGTVVLRNNGGNDLTVSANGSFTFSAPVAQGSPYAVTVLTQPAGQSCSVANGTGTVAGANVGDVTVSCAANTFTVGGTISGLSGTVVLQNNGGDNLTISVNGAFTFAAALINASPYAVTILAQPAGQTCTVANDAGTVNGTNVTNVTLTCSAIAFSVGGTVSGLSGSVVLQNNGGDELSISANGTFTFSTPIASGTAYSVTVLTQPTNPSQSCTVTNGSGSVGSGDVSNVSVSCTTNSFTVGGTVSGHNGTGLTLRLNGTTNLAVAGNGPYAFGAIADGSAYSVAVFVQPLNQSCTVANASGTLAGANVTNVTVTCTTNTHTIGGTVGGLSGTGLVLQNNGGDNLTVLANGAFTFSTAIASGSPYAVTVLTQPTNPSQTCTVTNGSASVGSGDVTNVTVTCVANTFTVGGTVSGLIGTVVLQNNGGDSLTLSANGGFTFAAALANTSHYAVTVLTQPTRQTCTVANGTGTVAGANVTNVNLSCAITQPSTITVSISPKLRGLTTSQTQLFNATVANDLGNAGVTWTSTGGSFANPTMTSVAFSSAAAGSFTITATSVADSSKSASATIGVTDLAGVFTQRYDAQRTGQNRREFALTAATVTGSTFGKLFSCAVDAEVYAQPLYVANAAIAASTHNVVLVATQNDSVYAFDADAKPCVQYWKKSFLGTGVTTVPPADTGQTGDINTKIGITGTPVIDPATGTLYVVAKTRETVGTRCSVVSPCYFQRLHALDIATGAEKFGGPANISPGITVPGGAVTNEPTCSSSAGNVPFCPLRENQRPGLLLLNGKVYVAWASHGDQDPYHGWVIGFSAADLTQAPVLFNTTPDGIRGGIWMTGTGPAADGGGNIYVISGNGTFDTAAPRTNYSDSFIKLSTATGLSVADFFTPANQSFLDSNDFDVGSGGAIVLPDSAGSPAHPHLLIGGDKQGVLYVIDRDNMTGFNAGGDQILQTVPITAGPACIICGIFSTPAFWEGKLYVAAIGDVLKQYTVANGVLSALPALQASDMLGFPGASPAVSSNGAANGIVWVLDTSNNGTPNPGLTSAPAILFAYDATNLNKLFSSPTSGAGAAGNAVKFAVPTVANGKVYVGTQDELSVFGLLPN